MAEDGIKFEKNRPVSEMGIKVGNILVGQTHMYRTITKWYIVKKVTNKRLVLRQLDVCYPTQYMSNTPGDYCMPVLENKIGDKTIYSLPNGYPFWSGHRDWGDTTASVSRYRYDFDKDWTYNIEILCDRYAPSLKLWDGNPGWVNCD